MRATRITRWAAVAAVVTAQALHAQGTPPAQPAASQAAPAAAPAQPPSVCGNTAYCAETNDFAAVITNFRTSDLRGYKMIDVVMHFVNKTSKSLVLGYVQNSGTIIDDKGNRYIVWGANGVRGIGQVYGGSFDPKFSVDAGSSGDAQFELAWYPGTQIYGFNFAFDLAIDEINSYEGGQHSLGSEFPLHFQGLANGISSSGQVAMGAGGAGGASASGAGADGQPCNNGAAGTATAVANATGSQAVQGAAQQGASTVAQATTAVQSVASLFSKKKSQPKPAANPCGSASGTVTQSAAGSVAPSAAAAGGASPAPAGNATTATAPAKATTSTDPAAMKAGVVRAGTTPPVTPPTTKTPPTTTTTTTTPTTHNPAPKNGNKKTVTPDTTTKHP